MAQTRYAVEQSRLPRPHGDPAKAPHASRSSRPAQPGAARQAVTELLAEADIRINGDRPWDLVVHKTKLFDRVLARGSLGLGESFMDGWWDVQQLDEFFSRVLRARLDEKLGRAGLLMHSLRARLFNLQSVRRAWQVGQEHYDLGNDFFEAMLDSRMAYTCGYWRHAENLEQAQEAKLDLICRKLELEPGMRLLDIGCGWGSLMQYAAAHYGVECVGVTISREQIEYGQKRCAGLPVTFRLTDYRELDEPFDRIASVGMFEHVGHKNHAEFFRVAERCLKDDGLFLLHTIGKKLRESTPDPWIDRYIFPNGDLPSLSQIADTSEHYFVTEDLHNFGADYDRTLMAWHSNFEAAWPRFAERYGERFYRMWRYYLLCCAGTFRSRTTQLWQLVMSPQGVMGGYESVR